MLLDHDDVIELNALERVALFLDLHPTIDVLYTDSDKIDELGHRIDVFRKPDWSPERFRAQNYMIHMAVVRRSLVETIGGFRAGFDGSQDYDLLLRATERARSVFHLPEVMYHWRIVPGSAAGDVLAKPGAYRAGAQAIRDHLERIGVNGTVEQLEDHPGNYRTVRRLTEKPKVSIVVPTTGTSRKVWGVEHTLVLRMLESLLNSTAYPNLEVAVVVDPSTTASVVEKLTRIGDERLKLLRGGATFDWSETANIGAASTEGELLLFLDDDIGFTDETWLGQLVAFAVEPDVGAVGPMVLYEDGRILSAGHCHIGRPEHLGRLRRSLEPGPLALFHINRECSGVVGACLLTRRDIFDRVGGMSTDYSSSYNDVDYCLKVRAQGFRVIWTPNARVFHFDQSTDRPEVKPSDVRLLLDRWNSEIERDQFVPDGPHESPELTRSRRTRPKRTIFVRGRDGACQPLGDFALGESL